LKKVISLRPTKTQLEIMEQQKASTAHKTLGIIGLVLASLAFIFSFVPCLGMYAIWPGIAGVILCVVAIAMASKAGAAKGIAVTGLCLAVVGTSVATWQFMTLKKGLEHFDSAFKDALDSANKAQQVSYDSTGMQAADESQRVIDSINNAATPTDAAAH
jgi:hypothetical protein